MPGQLPRPTEAELAILAVLWQRGRATVRDVYEALYERDGGHYTTALKLMQVMHAKGLLTRDESERSHVYAAAHPQDALQTNLLGDLISKAFAGSGKALVLAALKEHVTDAEREEIQRFLEENADG